MEIKHDEVNKKFFFEEEGNKGHLKYQSVDSNTLDYKSTFIDEDIRGEGYGKGLVKYALEYAKDKNLKVIPSCRMVSTYISRNPQYQNLVAISD